ncbi:hypothetical protein D038_3386A, partial [Vibrio parahaemolyticus IDH02189]
MNDHPFDATGV